MSSTAMKSTLSGLASAATTGAELRSRRAATSRTRHRMGVPRIDPGDGGAMRLSHAGAQMQEAEPGLRLDRVRMVGFEPTLSGTPNRRIARLSHILKTERPGGFE